MRTTVYIDDDLLENLMISSAKLGISHKIITRKLLHRMNLLKTAKPLLLSPVKYQDPAKNGKWRRLHLNISPQLYEKCLDMRKLFKLSLSRLFSEELKSNLTLIIRDLLCGKTLDNYQDTYFLIYKKDINGHNYKVYNTRHSMEKDIKT